MVRALFLMISMVSIVSSVKVSARNGEQNFVRMDYVQRNIKMKLNLVRPGQPDYGDKEVEIKLNHFLQRFNLNLEQFLELRHNDPADPKVQEVIRSAEFGDFMSDRPIDVIRDPYGYLHAFDGHHLLISLLKLEFDEFEMVLHEDFYVPPNRRARIDMGARMKEFEDYMEAAEEIGLVRLKTRTGRRLRFSELPQNPLDMDKNPFRSLVWLLRKADVFENQRKPMQEFAWADLLYWKFRARRWNLNFKTDHEYRVAAGRALQVLSSLTEEEKASLPGYLEIPSEHKPRRYRQYREVVITDCQTLMTEYHL